VLGKYIISDRPMTAEEWAKERATVIDAELAPEELVRLRPAKDQVNQRNDSRICYLGYSQDRR
jgi:hypothetical protein